MRLLERIESVAELESELVVCSFSLRRSSVLMPKRDNSSVSNGNRRYMVATD